MLVDEKNTFIDLLDKKMKGFCERAPIYISYKIMPQSLVIENVFTKDIYTFSFPESDVREDIKVSNFIFDIKQYLQKHYYPVIVKETIIRVEPKTEDIHKLMKDTGIQFEEAFSKLSKRKSVEKYVVDKVNIKKDQLILKSENGEQFVYETRMPVVVFLNKFLRITSESTPYETLVKNSKFLYKVNKQHD